VGRYARFYKFAIVNWFSVLDDRRARQRCVRSRLGDRTLNLAHVEFPEGTLWLDSLHVINGNFFYNVARYLRLALFDFFLKSLVFVVHLLEVFVLNFVALSHGLCHGLVIAGLQPWLYFGCNLI